MTASFVSGRGRPPRRRAPFTGKAFSDLALCMIGFGAGMGVMFPFAVIALGVPSHAVLRVVFFVGTITAGLIVAGMNFLLARRVVGSRLRELSERMSYVAGVITESTETGDWSRCTPEECQLVVDSADELGEVASSFNGLLYALAHSRAIEAAMAAFGGSLTQHCDVAEVAEVALRGFVNHCGADGGALGVVRDGEVAVVAAHRVDPAVVEGSPGVRAVLRETEAVITEVPEGLVVDASLLAFCPRQVVASPVRFRGVAVGFVVLAFADRAKPGAVRLLAGLESPCGVALNNALTHEHLQYLAAIDPLTGVYNRRFGDSRLSEEWARSLRHHTPLGLISFDLDHFKVINDTYGHLVGDRVLREVAAAVRLAIRDGDVLVRTGGEEFLALLPGAGKADVQAIAERMRRLVGTLAVPVDNAFAKVTVSLGGLSWPETDAEGTVDLLAALDLALYNSKQAGRDRLTMAGPYEPSASRTPTAVG